MSSIFRYALFPLQFHLLFLTQRLCVDVVATKHPFAEVLKTTRAFTQCCFWIVSAQEWTRPHLRSHYKTRQGRVLQCNVGAWGLAPAPFTHPPLPSSGTAACKSRGVREN